MGKDYAMLLTTLLWLRYLYYTLNYVTASSWLKEVTFTVTL